MLNKYKNGNKNSIFRFKKIQSVPTPTFLPASDIFLFSNFEIHKIIILGIGDIFGLLVFILLEKEYRRI